MAQHHGVYNVCIECPYDCGHIYECDAEVTHGYGDTEILVTVPKVTACPKCKAQYDTEDLAILSKRADDAGDELEWWD